MKGMQGVACYKSLYSADTEGSFHKSCWLGWSQSVQPAKQGSVLTVVETGILYLTYLIWTLALDSHLVLTDTALPQKDNLAFHLILQSCLGFHKGVAG